MESSQGSVEGCSTELKIKFAASDVQTSKDLEVLFGDRDIKLGWLFLPCCTAKWKAVISIFLKEARQGDAASHSMLALLLPVPAKPRECRRTGNIFLKFKYSQLSRQNPKFELVPEKKAVG